MAPRIDPIVSDINDRGYAIVPEVLDPTECERLRCEIAQVIEAERSKGRGGLRNLFQEVPCTRELAELPLLRELIQAVLGRSGFAVKGLFFDKTPQANWNVAWHQDLSIAVRARHEIVGIAGWSVKQGVPHVQPPLEILERLLTVRLHLDDCGLENGPLRVIPGTHWLGRLSSQQVQSQIAMAKAHDCLVPQGGAMLMRPLLLHASSAAVRPGHRRVLHFEYAADELPGDLDWYQRC